MFRESLLKSNAAGALQSCKFCKFMKNVLDTQFENILIALNRGFQTDFDPRGQYVPEAGVFAKIL